YINLGSTQDIDPTRLIGMINKQLRRRDLPIGKIEILKKFSFFEIADVSESDVQRAFNKLQVAGIPVVVELSNPDPKSKPDFRGRERSGRQKKRKNFHR
ncbi:MAG: DbpA RNA binding domain-containing protein, partial [Calditrichaeota bacterium]|nr:DbpA RNA binding domain-containing protein [Calditrichota bacterium]